MTDEERDRTIAQPQSDVDALKSVVDQLGSAVILSEQERLQAQEERGVVLQNLIDEVRQLNRNIEDLRDRR